MAAADFCKDLVSLSKYLGLAPQRLFFLASNSSNLYVPIEIKKRDGNSIRNIHIPISELKGVQKLILKKILREFSVSDHAYAYVAKRGVIEAANKLIGPNHIVRFDITDFFPSITSGRVYGLYKSLGFNDKVSYLLTSLTTYDGHLCQGAPTSPYISNLICKELDKRIYELCSKWQLGFLRYSDDLLIWGENDFNFSTILSITNSIVIKSGFEMNHKKTRFFKKNSHRHVLGLLVTDDKIKIPRKKLKDYRIAFYKASKNPKWGRENLSRLSGIASYYKTVYGSDDRYIEFSRIIENIRTFKVHESYAV